MAYGTALILKIDRDVLEQKFLRSNLTDEEREDLNDYPSFLKEYLDASVFETLQQVHLELVRKRLDPDAYLGSRYVCLPNEPEGVKEISGFTLGFFGDEDGYGEFGIDLVSRYKPVWIDWRMPHGGSGSPIVFDAEALEMIDMARDAIGKAIPEFADAPACVVLTHH